MPIIDAMIAELKQESVATRNTLERVPEDALDWRPHVKSFTMRQLASHLAENATWTKPILEQPEMVFDPKTYTPWIAATRAEMLEKFDASLAEALAAMAGVTDATLMATWALKANGQTFFEMPRMAVIRMMILNHMVHHRAQLGVYLRLRDVPVPAIYGPSADEQG
jgi:uncharacterized damage-inducible protein DinB